MINKDELRKEFIAKIPDMLRGKAVLDIDNETRVLYRDDVVEILKNSADFFLSKFSSHQQELVARIEGMQKEMDFELPEDMQWGKVRVEDYRFGYNQALSIVLSIINQSNKRA